MIAAFVWSFVVAHSVLQEAWCPMCASWTTPVILAREALDTLRAHNLRRSYWIPGSQQL
jgi:hypothetical protein